MAGLLLIVISFVGAQALSSLPISRVDAAPQVTGQNFKVTYEGRVTVRATNRTSFIYTVTGKGVPPALSHFELQIPSCTPPLQVAAYNPTEAVRFGVDPTTGLDGIKWDRPLQIDESQTYTVTLTGNVEESTTQAAVKTDGEYFTVAVPGPACPTTPTNSVDVEKYISSDLVNWADVDAAPGALAPIGSDVWFRFVVRNNGDSPLTNVTLTDSIFALPYCDIPARLNPGESVECTIGPASAVAGQHISTASVRAVSGSTTVSDSDSAHYHGGDIQLPVITIVDGTVQSINANILTIDGMNVEVDPNHPLLDLIRIGDLIRVEGNLVVDGDTANMLAVYVTMLGTNVAWRATGTSGSGSDVVAAPAPAAPAPAAPAPAAPAPVVAAPVDPAPAPANPAPPDPGPGNEGGGDDDDDDDKDKDKDDDGEGRGNRGRGNGRGGGDRDDD